ncbi:hypothetical protein Tsubulata_020299 [Turnera subulata]|uniref:Peptidase A1 domain-containing protein n=1 Tax=Turnera subulata TaxID=218843 RepID=A0A9Q0IYQ8_9ROSI|nr:hypothetical protein Tsubulata_020299 [Turnera subulata]
MAFSHALFLALMGLLSCIAAIKPNGLTMEVVHKDTPESPYYRNTADEKTPKPECPFASLNNPPPTKTETSTHTQALGKSEVINPPPTRYGDPFMFLVKVGVGTFGATSSNHSFKPYYLNIDSGTDLTWIQCEGCKSKPNMCFPQTDPVYPSSQSKSYKLLPCNHTALACHPKQECAAGSGSCAFNLTFSPGSYTSGTLAQETFTFPSPDGPPVAIQNITFGCSTDSRNIIYVLSTAPNPNPVSGVLSLGWGPRSFLSQTDALTQGKFSYCIKKNSTKPSYLKFGRDVTKPRNLQTTPISQVMPSSSYYMNLKGVSVNGQRLNMSPRELEVQRDGSGGCVIDSGSLVSYLKSSVFDVLHAALADHISKNKFLKRVIIHRKHKDLCYEELSPKGRKTLPVVKFHLEEADLEVEPEALFLFRQLRMDLSKELRTGKKVFCLAILTNEVKNTIGAYQQLNQKFVYDTKTKQLSFGPENCDENP